MALNKQTLRTRSLSAAVFVLVMLGSWLYSIYTFALCLLVIVGGLMYEWTGLCGIIKKRQNKNASYAIAILAAAVYAFLIYFFLRLAPSDFSGGGMRPEDAMFTLMLYGSWISALLLLVVTLISGDLPKLFFAGQLMLGFVFFVSSYALLLPLYNWHIPLVILLSVWTSDTGAYLVGSMIGKHKMAPTISPNKTWEGTFGGILLAVLMAIIVSRFYHGSAQYPLAAKDLILIALISAVTGTLGDLIQSAVKRMAGVKDSGNIMPGHGGFYDRFDAFSFAIPWVCLYLKYFYI